MGFTAYYIWRVMPKTKPPNKYAVARDTFAVIRQVIDNSTHLSLDNDCDRARLYDRICAELVKGCKL